MLGGIEVVSCRLPAAFTQAVVSSLLLPDEWLSASIAGQLVDRAEPNAPTAPTPHNLSPMVGNRLNQRRQTYSFRSDVSCLMLFGTV
eukprot:scaffold182437_cov49-Prasinocladus_malaysianus.AAC.1